MVLVNCLWWAGGRGIEGWPDIQDEIHPSLPFLSSDTNVIHAYGSRGEVLLRCPFKRDSLVRSVLICQSAASEALGSIAALTPRLQFSRAAPSQ